MRVLIDATGVTKKKAGVGVYAKNLIDRIARSRQFELFLLIQDDDPDLDYGQIPGVTVIRLPSRWLRKIPLRLLFEQVCLPVLLRRYRIDVVHSLHYMFSLLPSTAKKVVTIHDMTSFSMPEVHIRSRRELFRFFIRRAGKGTDGIIFVSRSAQQDFVDRFGTPKGISKVVYHGKNEVFGFPRTSIEVAQVKTKYALPANYILYIGTIEPRKNLVRLVEAFASLASTFPDTHLVIAGMMGWKQEHLLTLVHDLQLSSRVFFPGFVEEGDKPAIITGCTLFVYPSLYEGFGLPVLEAMASGVPVITSTTSSLPEVAGEAALLVDPKDTEALAQALRALLSDPTLRESLKGKGIEQARQFSWETAAADTMAVYLAVAKQ